MPAGKQETENFKRADEVLKEKEKIKKEAIKEFLAKHSVYAIEAYGFAYSKERVERLKELLHREGFTVWVYRRLI